MSVSTIDRIDHTNDAEIERMSGSISDIVSAINREGSNKALPSKMSAADVAAMVRRLGERGGIFYCKDDGHVVAFATVQPDDTEADTAVMGTWVLASHRRRGIGTELARSGVEFARDAGYKKLRGTIPVSNDQALSFFSAIGPIVQLEAGSMGYELPV
jgi:ribosomal protein S18 acetylase RimI-like enzyme